MSLRCILAAIVIGASSPGYALAEETGCLSAQAAEAQALELLRDNFIYPDMWASALPAEAEGPGRLVPIRRDTPCRGGLDQAVRGKDWSGSML